MVINVVIFNCHINNMPKSGVFAMIEIVKATMDDFDFADNENSKMFDTSDMHKI